MAKFILKTLLFLSVMFALIYRVSKNADGYTDNSYLKFTSPRQTSLIIGNSRSGQGLKPGVLNRILGRTDMYNYSFTFSDSPYGELYLESIKKKLDPSTRNGLFILSIGPWGLSRKKEHLKNTYSFRENDGVLTTPFVNMDPNIPYLLKHCNSKYNLLRKSQTSMLLHEDGWLEITIPMDSMSVKTRTDKKINLYKNKYLKSYSFSQIRYEYLKKTIDFLKNHGQVILVRLPVHEKMKEIENKVVPGFDKKMEKLSRTYLVPYFNYIDSSGSYQYTDGNHIYKGSAEKISEDLALKIKSYLEAKRLSIR